MPVSEFFAATVAMLESKGDDELVTAYVKAHANMLESHTEHK